MTSRAPASGFLLLTLLATACGSTTVLSGDGGGTSTAPPATSAPSTSTAMDTVTETGTSTETVPLAPPSPGEYDGAFHVSFLQSGPACPIPSHVEDAGQVDANTKTKLLGDGEGGAEVQCDNFGQYPFSLDAYGGITTTSGVRFWVDIPNDTLTGSFEGTVGYASPETGSMTFTGTCDFTVLHDEPEYGPTRFWVSFSCPAIASGSSVCGLDGIAAFEDCRYLICPGG